MNAYVMKVGVLWGVLGMASGVFGGTAGAESMPDVSPTRVLLPDGRELRTGGLRDGQVTATVDVVGASSSTSSMPSRMLYPRAGHSATVLPDGRVLIWGGSNESGHVITQGEWFDPATSRFSEATDIELLPRTGHTATLMTDGRMLLIGGRAEDLGTLTEAEVWDWRSNHSELLPTDLRPAREGHSASLLGDGRVLIVGPAGSRAALYDPERVRFLDAPAGLEDASPLPNALRVSGSVPAEHAKDVALDSVLALRFDPPMAPESISEATVTLFGPHGATPAIVVAAEAGRLAFVTPKQDLYPASGYTLFVQGAFDREGRSLPWYGMEFETARFMPDRMDSRLELLYGSSDSTAPINSGDEASTSGRTNPATSSGARSNSRKAVTNSHPYPFYEDPDGDEEFWVPTEANLDGRWRTSKDIPVGIRNSINLGLSKLSQQAAWRKGQLRATSTDISGQVLRFNDRPLSGVDVRLGKEHTRTDSDGRFAFRGVVPGHHELEIDGASVTSGGGSFGQFVLGINAEAGKENPIKPIYLPKIRQKDWIDIPSPLPADLVIKTPYMPGFEVHLPAGTILRGRDGKVIRRVAVIPMPLDRTPIDYPVNTPLHMTFQPGGMSVEGLTPGITEGIRFVYPNYTHAAPGTAAGFLNYDPTGKGWYTYGFGRVSEDGLSIRPDPGTRVYSATGFGVWFGSAPPPRLPPTSCGASPAMDGDPVDLRTGLFIHRTQGPALADVVPLSVRTTYRPGDTVTREFGKGTSHTYGTYLYNPEGWEHPPWNTFYVVLPDCSTVKFNRVSGGMLTPDFVALSEDTPTSFMGAKLTFPVDPYAIRLTKRDGTEMDFTVFGGELSRIGDRFGRSVEVTRSGGLISRITTQSGRYVDVLNSANRITNLTDSGGRQWSYQYNANGYLAQITHPDSSIEHFTYDTLGQMTEAFDRRGNRTVLNVYDGSGRVEQQTLADGATYHFAYTTDAQGVITQADVTRPNGSIRRVAFHMSGYPASDTEAVGTSLQRTVNYERDGIGFVHALVDPLGRRTEFTYDAERRVIGRTSLAGTPDARSTAYTYTTNHDLATMTDPWGRTSTYSWDARRHLSHVVDGLGRTREFGYNTRDQLERVTDSIGRSVFFGYDLYDLQTVTDPLLRVSTRYTDPLGRLRASKDALGRNTEIHYDVNDRVQKVVDPSGAATHYSYDAMGNLLALTDALSSTTTWTYDVRQRPITRTDALGQIESWTYSADGTTAAHTDRLIRSTTAQFDALGRLRLLNESDGRQLQPTYDLGDRLLSLSDSAAPSTIFTYNALDQVLTENGAAGNLTYTYDGHDRLASRTLSGQSAMTYSYDGRDRIISLTQSSDSVGFGYDSADRRTVTTLPNGVKTTADYDAGDQLTTLTYADGSTTLGTLTYVYDAAGQIVSRSGSWSNAPLPSATPSAGTVDANHRLISYGGQALTYDANGNLTADGLHTYVYDARDQLIEIKQGAITKAAFQYDTFGRRLAKTIDGTISTYRYDGANPIEEVSDGETRTIMSGLGIDERYARDDAAGREYFLTDRLGSTVALVDSIGGIVTRYHYEPYGDAVVDFVVGESTNSYQYTGRENDGFGLYYYRARYYSPSYMRFTQEDPQQFVDGPNLYAYVGGNPVMYYDPMGLWRWGDPIPQPAVDFSAGFGDTISFGVTYWARDQMGTNGAVDECSGGYSAGEWAGIGFGFAAGGAAGWRSANKKAGTEFSHWIPNRMGGPRSLWNGNYVSAVTHALSDPYRYRFMPKAWKALNPMPSQLTQQAVRVPNVYWGGAAGGAAAGASAAINGCGCP